jgi:hypothetical protein
MKAVLALALLCAVAPQSSYADDARRLVLVASAEAEIGALSSEDVRRLYLGAALARRDQRLQPVLNATDSRLEEVFLQKVIFLSSQAYRQRWLSLTFRAGVLQPEAYESESALVQAVANSKFAVTFMWEQDLANQPRLRKVLELWSGNVK